MSDTRRSRRRSSASSRVSSARGSSATSARSRAKSASAPPTPDPGPPEPEFPPLSYYASLDRFEEFCRDCLRIVDKNNRKVPLILNSTQRKILAVIRRLRDAGIPPRLIILKARQVGVSTLIEALLFWACLTQQHRSALVIAHVLKGSKVLLRMSRNFKRFLPKQLAAPRRIENVNEIEFDSGSRMQIEVAGEARAYAAQDVHLSEFGFYQKPDETLVAVMQTLPRTVDSLGVIESTANGVGNKFHKVWERATMLATDEEVAEDEKGWTPVFIPWYDHEEYDVPLDGKTFSILADELELKQAHPAITPENLKWRRAKINELDGDEDKFRQEYPSDPDEAFALSGRPAFDTRAVLHYRRCVAELLQKKAMPPRCEIESDPPGIGKPNIIVYDRGRLRIFFPREDRHTYIVGADPSEGDPGSDHSPLAVLDQMTMDLAATWYGKAPPDVLALHAIDMAHLYGDGLIINEANNHGILFHETVRQMGYPHLYFRKVSQDSVSGEVTEKPGYLSTRRNREHLFNTLRKFVRMRMGRIHCPYMVQQMQALVYIDDKAQAQAGSEKDLLIAFALCLMAHRGSMAVPLLPLPLKEMLEIATTAALIRERNAEGGSDFVYARTGMTMEQVLKIEDAHLASQARKRRYGLAGMR